MSSKSTQGGFKSHFSKPTAVVAIIIVVVFLTIILIYPRIFSPSNIGENTAPAPTDSARPPVQQ